MCSPAFFCWLEHTTLKPTKLNHPLFDTGLFRNRALRNLMVHHSYHYSISRYEACHDMPCSVFFWPSNKRDKWDKRDKRDKTNMPPALHFNTTASHHPPSKSKEKNTSQRFKQAKSSKSHHPVMTLEISCGKRMPTLPHLGFVRPPGHHGTKSVNLDLSMFGLNATVNMFFVSNSPTWHMFAWFCMCQLCLHRFLLRPPNLITFAHLSSQIYESHFGWS